MSDALHIGELRGGGLVLSYRCSSRCRHCLYGCGPHRRDGEARDEAELERLLDLLGEHAPRARFHIGGGEPFLKLPVLKRAIEGLVSRGLTLGYVETNAAWVRDRDHAEKILEDLAACGLDQVLVSVSPFHAEFIPPERPRLLIEAANRVLSHGAFVWLPDFWPDLAGSSDDQKLDLGRLLLQRGDGYARELAVRYGLVPGGRAGRFLFGHGERRPWQDAARDAPCRSRLADTSHFHVDARGRYVPGLCAGLVLPFEQVPGDIDLEPYPVLAALVRGGPGELVRLARDEGLVPLPAYSSACDLCTHARVFLHGRGHGYAELGPDGFYDTRSVQAFIVDGSQEVAG